MPLRKLIIENVRSIDHAELDFVTDGEPRQWTVLLGKNGTGKTTILRAAALVMAGSDALTELMREPATSVRNGKRSAKIRAVYSTRDGEPRETSIEWNAKDTVTAVVKKNASTLAGLDAAVEYTQRNYFVAGYGSSRRMPARNSPSFASGEVYSSLRALSVATLFSRDAALRPLDAWAVDLDYSRRDGLKVVREALNALLPGVRFKKIDKQKKEILFDTGDGVVALDRLSDGYQNMAGWIGDLLFRLTAAFADYAKPLAAGGILLLDEVDLHLHPEWQRQLLSFLSEQLPNFQFLATTHSPFTAHQCGPGALHVVERLEAKGPPSIRQYQGDPRMLRVDQVLSPLLGLPTTDSLETQNLREEYLSLKAAPKKNAWRLAEVRRELAERPAAQDGLLSRQERKMMALMERIEKRVGAKE
ncbi:MAG: chromosome segregation protein SMC [Acidobacteria bacterium]|nr:chromosome segregation protein SMC [Acidobacteriota bacterium]